MATQKPINITKGNDLPVTGDDNLSTEKNVEAWKAIGVGVPQLPPKVDTQPSSEKMEEYIENKRKAEKNKFSARDAAMITDEYSFEDFDAAVESTLNHIKEAAREGESEIIVSSLNMRRSLFNALMADMKKRNFSVRKHKKEEGIYVVAWGESKRESFISRHKWLYLVLAFVLYLGFWIGLGLVGRQFRDPPQPNQTNIERTK